MNYNIPKHILAFFSVLCITYSCIIKNKQNCIINKNASCDTIKYTNTKGQMIKAKYFIFNGIYIADKFVIEDTINLNINNDNQLDMIIVLTPKYLLPEIYDSTKDTNANIQKRLLAIIVSNQGGYSLRSQYPNLISSNGGVLSHYMGIKRNKFGFEVQHGKGSKFYFEHTMYFKFFDSDIYLDKISKLCSYNSRDSLFEYKYQGKSVSSININDTLTQNCNCDLFWEMLEKQ